MSATEAIRAACTAGVRLTADGEDLLLDAASPPPPAVIEKLSRHKAEVLKLLRPAGNVGRPRTGMRSSTNVPVLPSSMTGCRVQKLRITHSPAL